jgi:hypothetical protein
VFAGYSSAQHGPGQYDLAGVVLHTGSADRGHYTAFARLLPQAETETDFKPLDSDDTAYTAGSPKAEAGPHWYYFDDANVFPVESDKICTEQTSQMAYLLVYSRQLHVRSPRAADGSGAFAFPPTLASGSGSGSTTPTAASTTSSLGSTFRRSLSRSSTGMHGPGTVSIGVGDGPAVPPAVASVGPTPGAVGSSATGMPIAEIR